MTYVVNNNDVYSEHISQLFLVFFLLTVNR